MREKLKSFFVKLFTKERKKYLANHSLNMGVACMAVFLFEGKLWAVVPALIAYHAFFALTKSEGE